MPGASAGMTAHDVAERLPAHYKTVLEHLRGDRTPQLEHYRIGREYRVTEEQYDRFVARLIAAAGGDVVPFPPPPPPARGRARTRSRS